jgi:23S rRNA (uracil1939-C5)-methyltransferase
VRAEVADAAAWRRGAADAVVADPARPGLGRSAASALAESQAPVVVLVSCDPASLARDAGLLASHGYRLARVEVVDLFPHTFHVEAVSRFEFVGVVRPPR